MTTNTDEEKKVEEDTRVEEKKEAPVAAPPQIDPDLKKKAVQLVFETCDNAPCKNKNHRANIDRALQIIAQDMFPEMFKNGALVPPVPPPPPIKGKGNSATPSKRNKRKKASKRNK